jgi:hypothetical protein
MSKLVVRWILATLVFFPSVAGAQERGDVGVFMGYPSLGLIWQVSDKVALRPQISFDVSSAEVDSVFTGTGKAESWDIGFGATALFYLSDADRLRTYIAPQFTYSRSEGGRVDTDGTTTDSYSFAGLFGAEYSPTRRFGVFGELGVGYDRQTSDAGSGSANIKSNNFGTRAGVGVILYF